MKMIDGELLRRYARQRSEIAFEELVRRHIGLVYTAALRQVNNDAHLAEDVTQAVFTGLARKAAKLSTHPSLTAWLYTSTRFIAANIRRTEQRRATREQQSHAMNALHSAPEPETDWAQIRPLLDDAMHALDEEDCQAVLMRHFERCSYAEIGARFGVTEDSARMRVNRALEKLHDTLTKRGVTSTAVALAVLLAQNAVGAVPASLAGKTARAAISGTAGATALGTFLISKTMLGTAAVAVLAVVAMLAISRFGGASLNSKVTADTLANSIAEDAQSPIPPGKPSLAAPSKNDAVLHLQIVTADTGQPIPDVPIDCFDWSSGAEAKKLRGNRLGVCDVHYARQTERLELMTGKGPFADTRLLWQPRLGDVIPSNYVLRVERATPIGGVVLDPDGAPLAGALVTFNLAALEIAESKPLPKNEYYGIKFAATTEQSGRWQIDRISDAIIRYLVGGAMETNYVDADSVSTTRDHLAETQLRQGNYVFKLRRTVKAEGIVVDATGNPIAGATVIVGKNHDVTGNDGKFSVSGCVPWMQRIAASAAGFATTRIDVDLGIAANSTRIVLRPGKVLRIRVVDDQGNPVTNATIYSVSSSIAAAGRATFLQEPDPPSKQLDNEGRAEWENAPDAEIEFLVFALGYRQDTNEPIRPDGQEHVITLTPAEQMLPMSPSLKQELRARQ